MNRMVTLLLALGVASAAMAEPDLQAEIQAYHAASVVQYREVALVGIRQDLLDALASTRWSAALDLPPPEREVAVREKDPSGAIDPSGSAHLEP